MTARGQAACARRARGRVQADPKKTALTPAAVGPVGGWGARGRSPHRPVRGRAAGALVLCLHATPTRCPPPPPPPTPPQQPPVPIVYNLHPLPLTSLSRVKRGTRPPGRHHPSISPRECRRGPRQGFSPPNSGPHGPESGIGAEHCQLQNSGFIEELCR